MIYCACDLRQSDAVFDGRSYDIIRQTDAEDRFWNGEIL